MFKFEKIQTYPKSKVDEFYSKKVTDISELDEDVFRAEYLKNDLTLLEYVNRLKEVYNNKHSIPHKIPMYLDIENFTRKDLKPVDDTTLKYFYFSIGFFVSSVIDKYNIKSRYAIYNYGLFENDTLYTCYFDVSFTNFDIDLTRLGDLLKLIFKTELSTFTFRKVGELYELVFYKKDLYTIDYNSLYTSINFNKLLEDGYVIPLVLGKDDSSNNIVMDLNETTILNLVGDSSTGKSSLLYTLLLNLICLYDENEINIVSLTSRKKEIFNQYKYAPHIVGTHDIIENFNPILSEIKDELLLREDILENSGVSTWCELRELLLDENEFELLKAFPWLVLIIDDVEDIISELQLINKEEATKFESLLRYLVMNGENLGFKLITTATRMVETLKNIESSTHIVFNTSNDVFNTIVDSSFVDIPTEKGEFILITTENPFPLIGKASIIGTLDSKKRMYLTKAICLDMARNVSDTELFRSSTFHITSNKNEFMLEEDLFNPKKIFAIERDNRVLSIAVELLRGNYVSKADRT